MYHFIVSSSSSFHYRFAHWCGCGWMALSISCPVLSSFLARTNSAIISVTFAPIIWARNNSPYFASKMTLTNPSFAPDALALPDAKKETSNFQLITCFFCLCFRHTDARNFRPAVSTGWYIAVVNGFRMMTGLFFPRK